MRGDVSLLLFFVCLLSFLGCASLPNIDKLGSGESSISGQAPRIVSSEGELPPKVSKEIIRSLEHQVAPTDLLDRQTALMQSISGSPLIAGNKVTLLIDGRATYAAMSEAIRKARDHINLETFIFDDDEAGNHFAQLLIEKSLEGVQVNIIYDSFGCLRTPAAFFQRLRNAGISVLEFNPVNPLKAHLGWNLNYRDHRKILVVDGKIAFTGGVNISSVYSASSPGESHGHDDKRPWRDTHIEVEGPAVAAFQELFINTWARQHGPPLPGRDYFPYLQHAGNSLVRVVGSTPGRTNRITYLMYVTAIAHADNYIHLTTPYFVPDRQMIKALTEAAARGVDVKIVLPSSSDSTLAFHAGRFYYSRLLEAGVKLYERRGGMLHAKTAVIDDVWSTVGSTNMDLRSFLTNDEVNAIILGPDFASAMEAMFTADLQRSDPIDLEEWKERSVRDRTAEWLSHLLSRWL